MTLNGMAQEYSINAAILEIRIVQLGERLKGTRQLELRRRLKRRIGLLRVMMGESRRAAYDMDHYYERRGRG